MIGRRCKIVEDVIEKGHESVGVRGVTLWRGEVDSIRAEVKAHKFEIRRWCETSRSAGKNRSPERSVEMG